MANFTLPGIDDADAESVRSVLQERLVALLDTALTLKQSGGKTKIALKGRGPHLGGMNLLPLEFPVVVQLRNTSGNCWSSVFTSSPVNGREKVKAKAYAP